MFSGIYAFFEARGVDWETARRGRRRAASVIADPEAIASLSEIPDRIGEAQIVSFDLFDTLLHRTGLSLEGVQRKTAAYARMIAGPEAGDAIFAARGWFGQAVKKRMIAAGEGDEPPLVMIFREALIGAGLKPDAAEAAAGSLVSFEAETEAQGIVAAPGAVEMLKALRTRGLKVIAVTDMYLGGAEIDHILTRAGLRPLLDRVFVSADIGWTKRGGKLYPIVANEMEASEGFIHIGDRLDSDVTPARASGWRALHLVDRAAIAATETANIRESYSPTPAMRRKQLAKALDFADPGSLGSAEEIVDQLIGPAAGLLALQALTRARRIDAKKLFHLTRDGTLIGEIAEAARERHPHLAPDGLEIRELAMSRALGARLQVRGKDDLHRLGHLVPYLTKRPFSGKSLAAAFDLPEAVVPDLEGRALMESFEDPAIAGPLLEALDEGREKVEAYLKAAGLLEPHPMLAVDIGYSGTFAAQLSPFHADNPAEGRRLEFLFLMTSRYFNGNTRRIHPEIAIHPGVALDHRRRSARWATWNFAWIEPFLVDPERGRLESYGDDGPVFAESPCDEATRAQLLALRERIRARAARFIDEFHAAPGGFEEIAILLQRRFERFAGQPTRAEVRAVRAFSHQTGQVEITLHNPVRRVNPFRLYGELHRMKMSDEWVQGGLKYSGLGVVNRIMADAPETDGRADTRAPRD